MVLPGVHPTVDDGVVHGVAHGQPVDDKVDMLDVRVTLNLLMTIRNEEEGVLRQPTDAEYYDDHDHHLHHLQHLSFIIHPSITNKLHTIQCQPCRLFSSSDGDKDVLHMVKSTTRRQIPKHRRYINNYIYDRYNYKFPKAG